MNTLADSTISWKSNLTTMAMPEQALTLRADLDASYKAGYRDGSVSYELEHCPACKNVADLQAALDENAKLRESLERAAGIIADVCGECPACRYKWLSSDGCAEKCGTVTEEECWIAYLTGKRWDESGAEVDE